MIKPGRATRPLGLPNQKPRCWPSQREWTEYYRLATYCAEDGFNFCKDCTAAYQHQMRDEGRCAWPRTRFRVDRSGVISGRRVK